MGAVGLGEAWDTAHLSAAVEGDAQNQYQKGPAAIYVKGTPQFPEVELVVKIGSRIGNTPSLPMLSNVNCSAGWSKQC